MTNAALRHPAWPSTLGNMQVPAITPVRKNALLVTVVVLVLAGVSVDMYRKAGKAAPPAQQARQSSASNEQAAQDVLAKVAAIYDIPLQPQPTVATIVDVQALRKQNSFYDAAKNGDVLVVTQSRAILYDPVANKIIEVVPVQIQQAQPPQAPAQAASSSAAKK